MAKQRKTGATSKGVVKVTLDIRPGRVSAAQKRLAGHFWQKLISEVRDISSIP